MKSEIWYSSPGENRAPYDLHEVKYSSIQDKWSYKTRYDWSMFSGEMTTLGTVHPNEGREFNTRKQTIVKMLDDNRAGIEWFICASGEESQFLLENDKLFPTDAMIDVLKLNLEVGSERVELANGFTLVNCGWGGICVMVKMFTKKQDGEYQVHRHD